MLQNMILYHNPHKYDIFSAQSSGYYIIFGRLFSKNVVIFVVNVLENVTKYDAILKHG